MSRAVTRLSYLVALVSAGLALVYTLTYAVDVPFADDWGTVKVLYEDAAGTLSFPDLIAQHNEHRMLFPRLLVLVLAKAGSYDLVQQMIAVWASLLVTLLAIAFALRQSPGAAFAPLLVPMAFLVFSLRQSENLTLRHPDLVLARGDGRRAGRPPPRACSFRTSSLPPVCRRVIAATVAAFSSFQGLWAWPAGLLQLAIGGSARRLRPLLAIWAALGLGEWLFYLWGFERVPGHPDPFYGITQPLLALEYFVTLSGAALFGSVTAALGAGSVLVGAAVVALALTVRRRLVARSSFWISLLAFAVLIMLSITSGRSGWGIDGAATSRYSSYPILGVIAVLGLLAEPAVRGRTLLAAGSLAVVVGLVSASMPYGFDAGIEEGRRNRTVRSRAAWILATYREQPDAMLTNLFPSSGSVRAWAPLLERRRYGVFGRDEAPRPPAPSPSPATLVADGAPSFCTLDSLNDTGVHGASRLEVSLDHGAVVARGWCLDADGKRTAGGVYLRVDGRLVPAFYGELRDDVRKFFGGDVGLSGFEASFAPERGRQVHDLSLIALSPDRRRAYRATSPVTFRVATP